MYCGDCELSHECNNWEINGYCEDTEELELYSNDGYSDLERECEQDKDYIIHCEEMGDRL